MGASRFAEPRDPLLEHVGRLVQSTVQVEGPGEHGGAEADEPEITDLLADLQTSSHRRLGVDDEPPSQVPPRGRHPVPRDDLTIVESLRDLERLGQMRCRPVELVEVDDRECHDLQRVGQARRHRRPYGQRHRGRGVLLRRRRVNVCQRSREKVDGTGPWSNGRRLVSAVSIPNEREFDGRKEVTGEHGDVAAAPLVRARSESPSSIASARSHQRAPSRK